MSNKEKLVYFLSGALTYGAVLLIANLFGWL